MSCVLLRLHTGNKFTGKEVAGQLSFEDPHKALDHGTLSNKILRPFNLKT